jgi:hypothetical protein
MSRSCRVSEGPSPTGVNVGDLAKSVICWRFGLDGTPELAGDLELPSSLDGYSQWDKPT